MADISSTIKEAGTVQAEYFSPYRYRRYEIDAKTSLGDITTIATHTLFSIPKGEALIALDMWVITLFTSGGAATVQFSITGVDGSTNLTDVVPVADLKPARVFPLIPRIAVGAVAGHDATASTAVVSFKWQVATDTLTAGKIGVIATTIPNITGQTT